MNHTTTLMHLLAQPNRDPVRIVIPVRYVAHDRIVHATSLALTEEQVQVRSATPPERGTLIGLKLYFPDGAGVVNRSGIVAETVADEFRAEFNDADEVARHRIAEVLWKRKLGVHPCPRFHTHMEATLRQRGLPTLKGYVSNISRSGAFLRVETLPPRGSVVELDLLIPGGDCPHTVHAHVVHHAPRRGIGVQFVGASEEFTVCMEQYLAQMASPPSVRRRISVE